MNGWARLRTAAEANLWQTSKTTGAREMFFREDWNLLIEVRYTGYTVHSAIMYDGVSTRRLVPSDTHKADRIQAVLEGRKRDFDLTSNEGNPS